MSTKGYILNGVYHKTEAPLERMVNTQQTMYKQYDHARQRFDHSAEILQPYVGGKPNPKWAEINPEEAQAYGFTPRS